MESRSPTRGKGALTASILLEVLAVAFQAFAVFTAIPAAARQLGQMELYAWAFTCFQVMMLFAMVLAGYLADRTGIVIPLGIGLGLFIIGLVAAGFAPTMIWLLAFRLVQGFGAGLMEVSMMVLVAKAFSKEERPKVMTAFSFCWVVPSFIGPLLAAWIEQHFGWQWVFWLPVPLLVAAVCLGAGPISRFSATSEPSTASDKDIPLLIAGTTAIGTVLLQFAGQRLDPKGDVPLGGGGAGLTAIIAALALVVLSFSIPRLMPRGFLRLRVGLPAVIGERAFHSGSYLAGVYFVPLLLADEHGFSLVDAGLVITVGSVGWTIASWLQSRPWLRLRRDQIIILGAILGCIGTLTTVCGAAIPSTHWILIALGQFISGAGMGLASPSTSLATFKLSAPTELGHNTSALQVAEVLGNSLLTALAGTVFVLLRSSGNPHLTFGMLFGVCLLASGGAVLAATKIGEVANDALHSPSTGTD